jgi:hypothetical protein
MLLCLHAPCCVLLVDACDIKIDRPAEQVMKHAWCMTKGA